MARSLFCNKISVHMRLDVVYLVERLIVNDGESAGGESADEQRADQARRVGDGDGVDIVPGAISVRQGFFDDRVNDLQMAAGGDFRDDAAVFGVDVDLGIDHIRKQAFAVFNDRRRCFIAAGLDSQNPHLLLL